MSTQKSKSSKEKYDHPGMGARIKELRGKLTQAELAKIIGVAQGTEGKYEKGMMVSGDTLIRLSEHFGKTPQWILRGAEENENGLNQTSDGTHNQPMQLNGSNHHIDIYHVAGTANEPRPEYNDPIAQLFLKDWLTLSDVVKMRVWTLVKEEMEKVKKGES